MSSATTSKRSKPTNPVAGPGKQKKKFAEDAGLAHLLSLSQSIADAKSEALSQRVENNKRKVQAQQLKKQQDAQRKKERSIATQARPGANVRAKSKAEIKATLKAIKREKAKQRRENRRLKDKVSGDQVTQSPTSKGKTREKKVRKSVSFAPL